MAGLSEARYSVRKTVYFLLVFIALLSTLTVYRESWKPLFLDYLAPWAEKTQNMSHWWQDWQIYWKSQEEMQAEIDHLKKENQNLRTQLVQQLPLQQENTTLKALLNLPVPETYQRVPAKVIVRPPDQWFSRMQINSGFLKSLAPEQAVVSPFGLVGKIRSVTQESALVELITQPDHAVACYTEKSKKPAMLIGQFSNEYASLKYVQNIPNIEPGEKIYTSGKGKGYPEDLLLGEVTEVKKIPGVPTPEVKVKLSAFEQEIGDVMVLVPKP